MQGIIKYGNYSNCFEPTPERPLRVVEMTGDMESAGGNWRLARVNDNGFTFSDPKGRAKGLYLNGVKQDDYVYRRYEPYNKIEQFRALLQSKQAGEDAWDAWVWIVDYCQTNPSATKTTFLAAYDSQDFVAYQGFILKSIETIFGLTGYTSIRDAINTQERARLVGEPTELVEEFS